MLVSAQMHVLLLLLFTRLSLNVWRLQKLILSPSLESACNPFGTFIYRDTCTCKEGKLNFLSELNKAHVKKTTIYLWFRLTPKQGRWKDCSSCRRKWRRGLLSRVYREKRAKVKNKKTKNPLELCQGAVNTSHLHFVAQRSAFSEITTSYFLFSTLSEHHYRPAHSH